MKMNKQLEKVFIAIRPEIFGVPNEHVTLAFFNSAKLDTVVSVASEMRKHVPTEVEINGFANWKAPNGMHMEVALINAFNTPYLYRHVRTPHITLRKSNGPISNATFVPELFGESHIIDSLWLGKNIRGTLTWMPIENEPVMDTANRSWEIFGGL